MRLGCGEASFDPQEQGWPISRGVVFEPSDDLCTYTTFFYVSFPFTPSVDQLHSVIMTDVN